MNKQSCCPASHMWRSVLLWLSFTLLAVSAQVQTTIEAVSGSVQGGVEFVRIDLSQPLTAVPTGFSIQSPARIALDFPGIANGMGRSPCLRLPKAAIRCRSARIRPPSGTRPKSWWSTCGSAASRRTLRLLASRAEARGTACAWAASRRASPRRRCARVCRAKRRRPPS